jgi:hypothetical protein
MGGIFWHLSEARGCVNKVFPLSLLEQREPAGHSLDDCVNMIYVAAVHLYDALIQNNDPPADPNHKHEPIMGLRTRQVADLYRGYQGLIGVEHLYRNHISRVHMKVMAAPKTVSIQNAGFAALSLIIIDGWVRAILIDEAVSTGQVVNVLY